VSHAEIDFGTLLVGSPSLVRTIQVGRGGGGLPLTRLGRSGWETG